MVATTEKQAFVSLKKEIDGLSKYTLDLTGDFRELTAGTKNLNAGLVDLTTTLKVQTTFADKASTAFKGLGASALGFVRIGLSLSEVVFKVQSLVTIANAGYDAWKKWSGVSKTLTFSEAILGSDKLAKNIEFLGQTSDNIFNRIEQGAKAAFNPSEFAKWSSGAVTAFAQVEEAAYKLSTVTVSGTERSISVLGKNIEAMRKLQKETNFALNSVEILNAQYDIASAGFTDTASTQKVGKAAINLSQAGFGDLAGSTNGIVRVLKALGEEADTAERRAAQLFETTKIGLLTLDQLTPNVGSLSSQAKQLGVSFEEVTAAIAVLTTQGVSADEAANRLSSFLGDVVNVSPEAAQALGQFRDEAGKPIQLNATSLREKGIQGILKDLTTATGGELSKIQGIFSNQMTQEFVSLLVGAGDKALAEANQKITNVDPTTFKEEASNRGKTLNGAFSESFNQSQAAVEDFGSSLSKNVLSTLEDTNTVFGKIAESGTSAFGSLLGTISGVQQKVEAVGGFLATAFSVVAPFAFFTALGKGFQLLTAKLNSSKKEGESIFDVIKRTAYTNIEAIKDKIAALITDIRNRIDGVKKDLNELGNTPITDFEKDFNAATRSDFEKDFDDASSKQKYDKSFERDFDFAVAKQETSKEGVPDFLKDLDEAFEAKDIKKNQRELIRETGTFKQKLKANFDDISTSARKRFGDVKNSIKGLFSKGGAEEGLSSFGSQGGGLLKNATGLGSKAGGALAKGFGVAAPFLKQAAVMLGGLGLAAGAGALGLSIVSGWSDTLGKIANKSTIPELKEMKESLSSLQGVKGLEESLKEFDEFSSTLESGNYWLNVYGESLGRLQGLFNNLTGAGKQNSIIQEEIADRQKIIAQDTQNALAKGKQGQLDANNLAENKVNNKLATGVQLNAEDEKVVNDYYDNQITANKTLIQLQQQRIASEKAKGGGDPQVLEQLQTELDLTQQRVDAENKELDTQRDKILYLNKIAAFNSINTSIPLSLQVNANSEKAIKAQIDSLAVDFKDAFNGALNPEEAAKKLANVVPEIQSVLGTLETQIVLDPESAARLRQELEKTLGEDFNKYLASDPALRARYSQYLKTETDARNKQAQSKTTIKTTAFDTAQSLGLDNATIAAEKFKAQTEGINTQIAALNEELAKPSTPLSRQLEILNEIEQLESQRANSSAEARIKTELASTKQLLSLNQILLGIEQAKVNLFSQQNEFDLFSISLAKAKTAEASKNLELSKQQIEIENKESLIKKEEAVKALKARGERLADRVSNATSAFNSAKASSNPDSGTSPSEINNVLKSQLDRMTGDLNKQVSVIDQGRQQALDESNKKQNNFSEEEQQKIAKALTTNIATKYYDRSVQSVQKDIFNPDGSLKVDAEEIQRVLEDSLNKGLSYDRNAAFAGRDVFNQKRDEGALERQKINTDADTAIKNAKQSNQASADQLTSQFNQLSDSINNSGQEAKDSKKVVSDSEKELVFAQQAAALKETFGSLGQVIELNIAKIKEEFAGREKLQKFAEAIGGATTNIGSTVKGLGFLSGSFNALGAELENLGKDSSNPIGSIVNRRDQALRTIETTLTTTQEVFDNADKALNNAKKAGVSPETIKALQETRDEAKASLDTAKTEAVTDRARVTQQTNLEIINAKLQLFASRVNTANESLQAISEKINKQASLFKDLIDFQQRQRENGYQNNQARSDLQSALVGFFGDNNPFAKALGQRIEVQKIQDDTDRQKSQAITNNQKETIDLTVQKSQLELESQMLDNALTQTQLLSDILTVQQGGQAQFSNLEEVQARIADIPNILAQNQSLNAQQQGLLDQRLSYLPQELNDSLARLDAGSAARRVQALGSDLNPGNIDLIRQALGDSQTALSNLPRQNIPLPSTVNMSSMTGSLTNIQNGGDYADISKYLQSPVSSIRNDAFNLTRQQYGNNNTSSSPRIDAKPTINIQFNVGNNNQLGNGQVQQDLRRHVQTAVDESMKTLSSELRNYARNL